jgi:hypothetical protein
MIAIPFPGIRSQDGQIAKTTLLSALMPASYKVAAFPSRKLRALGAHAGIRQTHFIPHRHEKQAVPAMNQGISRLFPRDPCTIIS